MGGMRHARAERHKATKSHAPPVTPAVCGAVFPCCVRHRRRDGLRCHRQRPRLRSGLVPRLQHRLQAA